MKLPGVTVVITFDHSKFHVFDTSRSKDRWASTRGCYGSDDDDDNDDDGDGITETILFRAHSAHPVAALLPLDDTKVLRQLSHSSIVLREPSRPIRRVPTRHPLVGFPEGDGSLDLGFPHSNLALLVCQYRE